MIRYPEMNGESLSEFVLGELVNDSDALSTRQIKTGSQQKGKKTSRAKSLARTVSEMKQFKSVSSTVVSDNRRFVSPGFFSFNRFIMERTMFSTNDCTSGISEFWMTLTRTYGKKRGE